MSKLTYGCTLYYSYKAIWVLGHQSQRPLNRGNPQQLLRSWKSRISAKWPGQVAKQGKHMKRTTFQGPQEVVHEGPSLDTPLGSRTAPTPQFPSTLPAYLDVDWWFCFRALRTRRLERTGTDEMTFWKPWTTGAFIYRPPNPCTVSVFSI